MVRDETVDVGRVARDSDDLGQRFFVGHGPCDPELRHRENKRPGPYLVRLVRRLKEVQRTF